MEHPPFWNELTDSERGQYSQLTESQREALREWKLLGVEKIKEVLARHDASTEQADAGAETARTADAQTAQFRETTPLEQATPALDVDELVVELAPQERKVWDDLDDASQADLLKEIQDLPDKPTQLKNRLRKQRLSRGRGRRRGPDDETIHAEGEIGPLPADREAPDKALLEATTPADVLDALTRTTWASTHNNAECPAEQIPTEADLCAWITNCNEPTQIQASEHLNRLLAPAHGHGWHWSVVRSKEDPDLQIATAICFTDRGELVMSWYEESNTLGPAVLSIEQVHATWKAKAGAMTPPPDHRPPHPLAPIVAAWQARPKTAEPFRPKQKANLPDLRKTDSDTHLLEIQQPVAAANGQQLLLNLPELTPTAAGRSWLLDLFDRAGGQSMRQGRGASWDLRLFVGAMLHTPIAKRNSQWHSLKLDTAEVIDWLHPNGWSNRARDWEQLPVALFRMNKELGFVAIEGLGYVQIIGATTIPKTPNDPHVEFIVRIPQTAAHGARIDWPTLCKYGKHSATVYRAYLSAVEFMHLSAHNGQPITQEIGKPLLGKDGKPSRRKGGQLQRSKAETIPNSASRYVRGLTEGELVQMIGMNPANKNHRRMTRAAFEQLNDDGVIDLEQDGKVWRIFGPLPHSS